MTRCGGIPSWAATLAAVRSLSPVIIHTRTFSTFSRYSMTLRASERTTGVARRGLHPDPLEGALAQDASVPDAVQRDAAGHAEVLQPARLAMREARHAQHGLRMTFVRSAFYSKIELVGIDALRVGSLGIWTLF